MSDRPQQPPYPLRMPQELRERLEEAAKATGRSLNAEIVQRLESSLLHSPDEVSRQLRLTEFEGAAGRINTLSLATLLQKISEEIGPSLKAAGHPLSATIESAKQTATLTATALKARSDEDAALLQRVIAELNADAKVLDSLEPKKVKRKPKPLDK
ncbi:Arc family DNA-binding protein [Paraburkholderia hospita]|uniref:Arc family DNA-binding protein n=1 Tax=Paraburkholderia hospita TaxID=169430 RepID=UPI003ECDFC63